LRLTTRHVGVAVVLVVGGAIAWKATGASLDFTVDVTVDVLFLFSFSVVRVVAVKSMLRKLAISSSAAC